MPIYEFRCKSCKAVHEMILGLRDPHPTRCDKCGKGTLEKIISRTGRVSRLSNSQQEYIEGSLANGDNLTVPAPENCIIDEHGHYEEVDPKDPAVQDKIIRKKDVDEAS